MLGGVDPRALRELRLEKIRMSVVGAVEVASLQSRRDVALMAVLLTLTGTLVLAGLAGQVPIDVVRPVGIGLLVATAWVGYHMKTLSKQVRDAIRDAGLAVDTLMLEEDEDHDDGEEADPSGT